MDHYKHDFLSIQYCLSVWARVVESAYGEAHLKKVLKRLSSILRGRENVAFAPDCGVLWKKVMTWR